VPTIASRTVAVLFGFVTGLTLVEGGLRVAAFFQARSTRTRLAGDGDTTRPLVAFVGDSNVWGLYVEPHETVAKVVERMSRAGGAVGISTVNFAKPGSPTWAVVDQLKRALALKPVAVVARCGINNFSMVPPGEGGGVLEDLLIVKAARRAMLNWRWRDAKPWMQPVSGAKGPQEVGGFSKQGENATLFAVKARDGFDDPVEVLKTSNVLPFEKHAERMRADYLKMAELAQAGGAKLVLATYLAGLEEGFNAVRQLMAGLAGQKGITVSDCTKGMALALQSVPQEARGAMRARLLTTDQHPTPLGYEVEARILAKTLKEIGVLPDIALESPTAPLQGVKVVAPKLRLVPGEKWTFEVEGEPKDLARLLMGTPGNSTVDLVNVPFNANTYLRVLTLGPRIAAQTFVTLDEKGLGRIEVPDLVRQNLKGPLKAACLVYRGGKESYAQTVLTPVIDVP